MSQPGPDPNRAPNSPFKSKKWLIIFGVTVVGLAIVLPIVLITSSTHVLSPTTSSVNVVSASSVQGIFGGSWRVALNNTCDQVIERIPGITNITAYQNGTTVTLSCPHLLRLFHREVLVGNVNGTNATITIEEMQIIESVGNASNVTIQGIDIPGIFHVPQEPQMPTGFILKLTRYDGYTILYVTRVYSNNTSTLVEAVKGNEFIRIEINGVNASLQQAEEFLKSI